MENDCGEESGKQHLRNEACEDLEEEKVVLQGTNDVSSEDTENKNTAVQDLPSTQLTSCVQSAEMNQFGNKQTPLSQKSDRNLEQMEASIKNPPTGTSTVLTQQLAMLHVQTKNLRAILGIQQQELEQKTAAVLQSSEMCSVNDELATKAMATLNANIAGGVEHPQSTSAVTQASKCDVAAKPSTSSSRSQRPSRRELQEQVEGLQELLSQLTIKNPQIIGSVQTIVQNSPKLRNVNLFRTINTDATNTGAVPRFTGGNGRVAAAYTTKQRKESDMSSASTVAAQKDTSTKAAANNTDAAQSSARKRGQRKRKNKSLKPPKNLASELESFSKYINTIVSEYLGAEQKEKAELLEFKGTFEDLEAHAQKLVQAGIGRIVEEEIRINRKNNRQSFITMSADREGAERDGIILLPVARRYAFEGDIVRAFVMNAGPSTIQQPITKNDNDTEINNENYLEKGGSTIIGGKDNSFCLADDEDPFEDTESPDSEVDGTELDAGAAAVPDNCPKSFVINIVRQTDLREVVGTISFKNSTKLNDEANYYKLKPYDMRVPMIYVPVESCAAHITSENKADVCGMLYLAHILETDINGHCIGELVQPVGKVGNMEAELKAILLHNGLKNIKPFEQRFNDLYAQPDPPISTTNLHGREDLREKCIITIDPLTARDLDDAVSLERLGDDLFEVGVHISDVSHYLVEDCELDNIVKKRATSIYLVNEVIHMLPQTLCFKCSLLPGEDKFAFSVFWRMNTRGDILGQPRFTRTVINSCVQLAYEHAQKIIDNPSEEFGVDDFPTICNGFTASDICSRIKILNTMAEKMREKRYDGGALSINNPKIRFNLDPTTGEALSYEIDGRQEANFLIEEFMLLANQSVARFIYDRFPNISILRNHAPPLSKSMKNLREKLANLGMELDCTSSKTLYASMQKLCREAKDPAAMDACLSTLLTKPMARAKYFCSEGKSEEADLWHYALSIPIYTHFTSPIRRYPDILVHRVLAAALDYAPPPKRTPDELHMLAKVCNDQKYNAKSAGDESINLFFKRYIKEKQSITLRAVVTEIFQHLLNVVTIDTGHLISINFKIQKVLVDTSNAPGYVLIAERNSKTPPVKLQLFSTIDVKLVIWDDRVCGFFVSPDPKQRQINSIEISKKKQQLTGSSANNSVSESSGSRRQRRTSQRNTQQQHELNEAQTQQPQEDKKNSKLKTKQCTNNSNNKNHVETRVYAVRHDSEN
ncbi:DIS3-like exonuclease 2 [Eurosta solidaginis]|uniref:DIS3-like exonuclease 2 n=1 Tax=Eurosta solidaginis TaxID=178769 RepID=UPI00353151A6